MLANYLKYNLNDVLVEVKELLSCLNQLGYANIVDIPLRKYSNSEHLKVYEKHFLGKEKTKLFSVSSAPEKYQKSFLTCYELKLAYELFFLNQPKTFIEINKVLDESTLNSLITYGIIIAIKDTLKSVLRLVPIENCYYVTSAFDRSLEHFTYLSYDSIRFAELIKKDLQPASKSKHILDLCSGVGFLGLQLMEARDSLTGIDINEYAIQMARLNAMLQDQKRVNFYRGSKAIKIDFYDLAVCNPPFVFLQDQESNKVDSYGGGSYGLELSLQFLGHMFTGLKPGGTGYMLTCSPIINDRLIAVDMINEMGLAVKGYCRELSPSLERPAQWQLDLGIKEFVHCFIKIQKKIEDRSLTQIKHIRMNETEKFKYAF